MSTNKEMLARLLEEEEGKRNIAYQDSEGNWTIGIGHLLDAQTDAELAILGLEDDLDDWTGFAITDAQVYQLLDHDIEETLSRLRNAFDDSLLDALDPQRYMSVFQMCYQIGSVTGFPAFCNAVREGDWDRASKEMLYRDGTKCEVHSRWYKQTPKRCQRMADLMRQGALATPSPASYGSIPAPYAEKLAAARAALDELEAELKIGE